MVEKKVSRRAQAAEKVGRQLSEARAKKQASLEEASAALNIHVSQLRALEEGDFSVFAADVYARGAYLKYANWLGLNSEQTQRPFLRALSAVRVTRPLNLHTPETWYQRLVSPRLLIVVAGVLLAGAVGGYISWQVRSFWQLPDLEVTSPVDRVISDTSVEVRGSSEPQARVRINNQSVLLQDDDNFSLNINLHPGINILRIEAENAAGRTRVVEYHLLHPRQTVGS